MDNATVFGKTELGEKAYQDANAPLTKAERGLLIMLDGQRPMRDIYRFSAVFGDCDALAERLRSHGYITPVVKTAPQSAASTSASISTFTQARATLSRSIAHTLGSYGDKLCRQIDETGDVEALRSACFTAAHVLENIKGKAVATDFRSQVETQLSA